MSSLAPPATPPLEMPMFPDWLDLPEGYLVQDWIAWKKGEAVARRLREQPGLLETARQRLLEFQEKRGGLRGCDQEWLTLLDSTPVEKIASILETADHEGQRLRSSSPFNSPVFLNPDEREAILERAYGR